MRRFLSFAVLSLLAFGCKKNDRGYGERGAASSMAGTMASANAAADENAGAASAMAPGAPGESIPAPADVAAPPEDAQRTESGLAYKVLQPGTGEAHPAAEDRVEVNYTGWTTDGEMFDSSVTRGRPATFPLNRVIPGWTEGVQLMVVGEKTRFWIPEELAYGGRPGAPAGMLVFDIELLGITAAPQPMPIPETPENVAAAPADAEATESGLKHKLLEAGTGEKHPAATDRVEVHYAGWTTEGRLFDASYRRGQPAQFPLNGVIDGWTEGVQLMVEGEKRRFWIPADLAYGATPSRPGAPAGMLVFDIHLLRILE